jgi:hypothetical protein
MHEILHRQQTFPCLLRVPLLTVLLTSAPDEVSGHVDALAALPLGKEPLVPWMEPRAGLDAVEKRKISCPCPETNRCIKGKSVSVRN